MPCRAISLLFVAFSLAVASCSGSARKLRTAVSRFRVPAHFPRAAVSEVVCGLPCSAPGSPRHLPLDGQRWRHRAIHGGEG